MSPSRGAPADPREAAHDARLRYVSDASPGIHRQKKGKSFAYVRANGAPVKDAATLERMRSLAIPPAWTDVWICPHPRGHLQATGRDARGRKQYRYHPDWRAVRDRTKYDKLASFGALLPIIRRRVEHDLRQSGMPRTKVLATIVRILDLTHMRIGNEEYARENHSYGLTTLRDTHARVSGLDVRFAFRGKSGRRQNLHVRDPRIARIVRRCAELPGQELFAYEDENGDVIDVGSEDVNDYLREITGEPITAKDFRTWGGTVHAAACLLALGECDTEAEAAHCMVSAVKQVAEVLGNRPATCKKYYIDPRVFTAYRRRRLCETLTRALKKNKKQKTKNIKPIERAVLTMLNEHESEKF